MLNPATTRTKQSETKTESGNSGTPRTREGTRSRNYDRHDSSIDDHASMSWCSSNQGQGEKGAGSKEEKERYTFSARTFFIQSLHSNATFAHTTVGHREIESTEEGRFRSQGQRSDRLVGPKGYRQDTRHSGTHIGTHNREGQGLFAKVLTWSDNVHQSPQSHIHQKVVPLK